MSARGIFKIGFFTAVSFVLLWTLLFVILQAIYPLEYSDYVMKYSKEYNVDSSLVFSVMKNESGFNKDACSPKRAIGLMQITPETADWIAEKIDITNYSLTDPETNIRFSCWYLGYLQDKFENIQTTVAAYNAGEGNVTSWLNDKNHSFDGYVLSDIPFYETKVYVKKVMNTYKVYKKLY